MNISILGYGNVGTRLARLFDAAGHGVTIGLRGEQTAATPYPQTDFQTAVAQADAVVLALPYTAALQILPELSSSLKGKIIIDSTNPLNPDWSPLLLGQHTSAGEELQRLLPESFVVKAFNTIFADMMTAQAQVCHGQRITAFVAGNHALAVQTVAQLAQDIGFAPLLVGPLSVARFLESMAHLNIQIAVGQGGGTNAAFIYHQAH